MADVNKFIGIGRLTRDPQLKYLPNQTAVCEFGLAIGRKFKGSDGQQREETTFVDCVTFAKGAEIFNQYMSKGKPVYVEGRLKLDVWEKDGQKRSKMSVVVENFQFLGDRSQGDESSQTNDYPRNPRKAPQREAGAAPQAPYDEGGSQFEEDSIPFEYGR